MTDKRNVSPDELLKRMGIKERDFKEYVSKVSHLFNSLNKDEQQFYLKNNGRTLAQIAKSLGSDVTVGDVEVLWGGVPRIGEICILACCGHGPAPPPPGPGSATPNAPATNT